MQLVDNHLGQTMTQTSETPPAQPPASTPPRRIFQQCDTVARFPYKPNEYARRLLWNMVQATLMRFSPNKLSQWRRFWLRLFGGTIPNTSHFRSKTRIFHPWLLTMGEYSMFSDGVVIYNLGPVSIGDHTAISQDAYICAGTHDYTQPNLPLIRPSITIGSGVWICAGAFIGPGVTIGDNSIVAARAVVTKDVPPNVIVGGNPAKVIGLRPMPGLDVSQSVEE